MDRHPQTPPRAAGDPPAPDTKAEWRQRLTAARRARPDAERVAAGRLIAAVLCGSLGRPVQTVAAYAGVGSEPPTRVLLNALVSMGRDVLLPVVLADGRLEWAVYDDWDELVPGPIGLREPAGRRLGPGALALAHLVLAPALAVDRSGTRLGRGAGYYDRALEGIDPGRVYAVVYDDELVEHLPCEPHDRPVGAALTPSGIVPLGG